MNEDIVQLADKYDLDHDDILILKEFVQLEPEDREAVIKYLKRLSDTFAARQKTAPENASSRPGIPIAEDADVFVSSLPLPTYEEAMEQLRRDEREREKKKDPSSDVG